MTTPTTTPTAPATPAPMRLYRFAFGLYEDADNLYTLALIPARLDDEAFDKGCTLMPADAPALARDYWRRSGAQPGPNADPAGAFFTAQELTADDDATMYAEDMPCDVRDLLEDFGR